MREPLELKSWQVEALARVAELTGGVVEGDRVRIVRGRTTAEAFVGARTMIAGVPTEVEVRLRARVETAPGDGGAEEPGPFRSTASARRRVRWRPRIALGAKFVTAGVTIVDPDRPLQPVDPRIEGVRFASDATDAEVREVLGAADLQGRIADLFELRCDSVSINEGGEWLFVRFRLQPDAEAARAASVGERARVRSIVVATVALSDALPVFAGPARERPLLSKLSRMLPWLLPLVGVPLAGAGTSWRLPIDEAPPLAFAGFGLALWVPCLLGAWLLLRRKHSRRLPGTRKRLVVPGLLALLGLSMSCMGLGLLINGCDGGPLKRHGVEVLSKHLRKGHHYLDVKEFRPGESGFLRVEAGEDLWARTAPGQRVVLVLGPGRLGWPWLARVEEAPPR